VLGVAKAFHLDQEKNKLKLSVMNALTGSIFEDDPHGN